MTLPELKTILLDLPRPGVLRATLNRPDRLNAMTATMFEELGAVAATAKATRSVRVLIITGAGHGFCSGYDLEDAGGLHELTQSQMLDRQQTAADAVAAIHDLRVPVIAAINGAAAGGGFSLALASDIRIASTAAKFSALFVRIGLGAGDLGTTWFLPRIVGLGVASEMIYTGRPVDAAEALQVQLVNVVVKPDALADRALACAEQIAANAPLGVRMTKRSLLANIDAPSLRSALEVENRAQAMLTRGPDLLEAIAARTERRPPIFPD